MFYNQSVTDICEECVNKRKESEEQEQLIYTRGKLVIRVANSDDSAAEDKKTDDWVSDIISRI